MTGNGPATARRHDHYRHGCRFVLDGTPGNNGALHVPSGAIDPKSTKVLLTLLEIFSEEGRVTVPTIARRTGYSKSTVHERLHHLRHLGMVTWVPERKGTIRPAVQVAR